MTADEITPALTVEQWAEWRGEAERISNDESDVVSWDAISRRYGRHGVAAIALDEEPFGFTREDVAMLRTVQLADYRDEYRRAFDSLADRIAALLPPDEAV